MLFGLSQSQSEMPKTCCVLTRTEQTGSDSQLRVTLVAAAGAAVQCSLNTEALDALCTLTSDHNNVVLFCVCVQQTCTLKCKKKAMFIICF